MSLKPLHLTYVLMLFFWSSLTAARVTLSLYALHLGAQPDSVGLLYAVYYALPLALSWPVGRLTDRLGSRWLLTVSAVTTTGGMLVPFFVRDVQALYMAALLIGLSFTINNVTLQNLVGLLSANSHERARNFSQAGVVGSVTSFAAPLFAGIAIDHAGHAWACLLVGTVAIPAGAILLLWGGALPGPSRRSADAVKLRDTLSDPAVLRVLAISALAQIGQDVFHFFIPIYAYHLGLAASVIGAILAALAMAEFIVRVIMPRLIAVLGEETLLAYSFIISASGYVLVPLIGNAWLLGLVCFMFGLSMGCSQPVVTMLMFDRCAEGRSGEMFGVRQTVNNLMRAGGPTMFGFVASAVGLSSGFWLSALLLGAGGWFTFPKGKKQQGS